MSDPAFHAKTCNCPANSPFHWMHNRPEKSFAAEFQRGVVNAKSSTDHVENSRAEGVDPGYIAGLTHRAAKPKADRKNLVLKTARNGISIAPKADTEKRHKLRLASI